MKILNWPRLLELFSWLAPEAERSDKYPPAPDETVVYAIGDIHGRFDLLESLGAQLTQDSSNHRKKYVEVYLGDYIDRGPDSFKVIDWLLKRQRERNLRLLRGNHERILTDFLAETATFEDWRQIGGLETVASYGVDPAILQDPRDEEDIRLAFLSNFPSEHRGFLNALEMTLELGAYFFVHAGVRPGIPLDEQVEGDCLWIRDDFLDYEDAFDRIIVHGHSPVQEPELLPNRINLDTGAYATGRLSCLKITEQGARLFSGADL